MTDEERSIPHQTSRENAFDNLDGIDPLNIKALSLLKELHTFIADSKNDDDRADKNETDITFEDKVELGKNLRTTLEEYVVLLSQPLDDTQTQSDSRIYAHATILFNSLTHPENVSMKEVFESLLTFDVLQNYQRGNKGIKIIDVPAPDSQANTTNTATTISILSGVKVYAESDGSYVVELQGIASDYSDANLRIPVNQLANRIIFLKSYPHDR